MTIHRIEALQNMFLEGLLKVPLFTFVAGVLAVTSLAGCGKEDASGVIVSLQTASTTTLTVGSQVESGFDPATGKSSGGTVAITSGAFISSDPSELGPVVAKVKIDSGKSTTIDLPPGGYAATVDDDGTDRRCQQVTFQVESNKRAKLVLFCGAATTKSS